MISNASAVVIGAGAFGLSTGLQLARQGLTDVVVVDQFEPGSQTSPRAAGLFKLIQPDETRTRLSQRSIEIVLGFEEEFGVQLPVERSGSLMVARTPEHADLIEREMKQSRAWGVELEEISHEEANRLMPCLDDPSTLRIVCHGPGDVYIEEPASLLAAYREAAEKLGVRILGNTPVTGIRVAAGRVEGVETPEGAIASPVVVDAAGMWARLVGLMGQTDVPVAPVRHQLFITEPVPGTGPHQPIVRFIDSAVYVRPARGGIMLGGFEADPVPVNPASRRNYTVRDVPLDMSVLDRLAGSIEREMPVVTDAPVVEHRGGAFTMTPDGRFLAGPVPGAPGLWSATGCNGSGFSSSPAIGEMLAEWIVQGEPCIDMTILSPKRFAGTRFSEEQLRRDGVWQYAHYYDPGASQG